MVCHVRGGYLGSHAGGCFFLCHVLALGCGWGGSGPGYVEQLGMERSESGLILPALSGFALFPSLSLDLPPLRSAVLGSFLQAHCPIPVHGPLVWGACLWPPELMGVWGCGAWVGSLCDWL